MKIKKIYLALGLVIIVLLFTNPSQNDFISFLHAKNIEYNKEGTGRIYNCLIFSIYSTQYEFTRKSISIDHSLDKYKADSTMSIRDSNEIEKNKRAAQDKFKQVLKNETNKKFYSYEQLYNMVAKNMPELTKDQYDEDTRNPQKCYTLFNNIKKSNTPNKVPKTYSDFVDYYGFNIPIYGKKIASIPVINDTVYQTITVDTNKRFIGILKNFF